MHLKKQHLEPDMKLRTGSKLGKDSVKAVYRHPAYLTCMQSTSWEMPGWMNHKLVSRWQGEMSITSDIQLKNHSNGRKPREAKEPLNEGDRGEWKSWLKTQHPKNEDHGMQSHHFRVHRWGKNGNSDRLSFLGLQNHSGLWLLPWN